MSGNNATNGRTVKNLQENPADGEGGGGEGDEGKTEIPPEGSRSL